MFTNNANTMIAVSSTIEYDTVWEDVQGMPYLVTGDVTINANRTLTIDPGVVVKFQAKTVSDHYRQNIYVNGVLDVQGTASEPVVFTSSYDDSDIAGGDTNNDGDATSPSNGNWGFIKYQGAQANMLDYAIIRYGGIRRPYNNYDPYMIWVLNGSLLKIDNCKIEYAYQKSIYCNNSHLVIENSLLNYSGQIAVQVDGGSIIAEYNTLHEFGGTGFYISNDARAVIIHNNFIDTPQIINQGTPDEYEQWDIGVNNVSTGNTIDTRANWWMSVNGPSFEQDHGSSIRAYGLMDYTPWVTTEIDDELPGSPEIISTSSTEAILDEVYWYDSDGYAEAIGSGSLYWQIWYGPDDMAIQSDTGLITWTPYESGIHTVGLMVSNDHGYDLQWFDIVVYPYGGIDIPDMSGLSEARAIQMITDYGLNLGTITYESSETVPAGCVIRTDPEPGTSVAPELAINIVISTGIETDILLDGIVNLKDFAVLASYWMSPCGSSNNFCDNADLNDSGLVDIADLIIMADKWLSSQTISFYQQNLDDNPQWTMQGQWQFGMPQGAGGEQHGVSDPASSYTGDNVIGVNLAGDYDTTPGGPYNLITGPFDCTGKNNVKVKFARWLNIDEPTYAKAAIEVSNDGQQWHTVWQNSGRAPITDYYWTVQEYSLSPYADNQNSVYLRFSYEILDWAYPYSGWNIDDIELLASP